MISLNLNAVTKQEIAEAYWAFEKPWQAYRKRTGDRRDASKCGDSVIAEKAKKFLVLFDRWKAENCGKWAISSDGEPISVPAICNA